MTAARSNSLTSDGLSHRAQSGEQEAEAEFLAQVRAGDEDASAQFVRQYGGPMMAVARRYFRHEQDRADAVQDAFLSAFRSLHDFEGHSSLGTWLYRIVVNACLTKLRTNTRKPEVPIDDLLPTFDETGHHSRPVRPWRHQALAQLTRAETCDHVRACIDRLPDPYGRVLLLRDIEELDTEQTAQHLGITPGAVKTRLHRARQALRLLLEPLFVG
jgi:RNA polymerase sigma-70 factor, ECF subfamily